MKHNWITDMTTNNVDKAVHVTPFSVVAEQLSRHGICGLLVVDSDDKVVGVISETDLMMRQVAEQG